MQFAFDTSPARVLFGRGTVRTALPAELVMLGLERLLVVAGRADEEHARRVIRPFPEVAAGWVRVEGESDVAPARSAARQARADGVLAVGSSTAITVAGAVAQENRLPVVAVPTTYGGTDPAPVWTAAGRSRRALTHRTVVLDPDVTDELPREVAVASALVATARAVEGHWAPGANPLSAALADEALRSLATGLRAIGPVSLARSGAPDLALADPVRVWAGSAASAGEQLLYGAFLAGSVVATTGTGLHHRLCQILTDAFRLPAAPTSAVLLPHVLAFNAPAVPAAAARIARALDAESAADGVRRLSADVGAARTLGGLGLRHKDLAEAVDRVAAALPVPNPRPVGTEEVRFLLSTALEGGA